MIKRSPILTLSEDEEDMPSPEGYGYYTDWWDTTDEIPWLCFFGANQLWVLDNPTSTFTQMRICGSDKPVHEGFAVRPERRQEGINWRWIRKDKRYEDIEDVFSCSRYKDFADWLESFNTNYGPVWIWIEEA